ncbi:MAG TPA: serine/threonine-protein kinase [Pseudomonadales bacterium]|nr:serine/threonine-protein kinase [Pseudomonadales bacterium]
MAIFTKALQLPVEQRDSFILQACGGNDSLRRKVETLLNANARVGSFLENSLVRPPIEICPEAPIGEKPGDWVGRYKLLQQIGEGGWGVVFMAEQQEPVRRKVALKVVKPGMDTKNVIARFEAERQALALMDHPNIAHVFDAGATDTGRPYFVMELIRGIKITDYCDHHSLTTPARLELFIQVCDAVQHAHQKGIAHRDIKPSNILVTTTGDGGPLPMVIDFGIAKATTDLRLTDKTLFTAFEMLIGTPAYMSPEQAALTNVDVDTRTDIYSLGVLLYEILTGRTPFDTRELLKAGLDEVRRVICTEEPVRPSTRLVTMLASELTIQSEHRRIEPSKLIREVRGDLDWIVMKALEKDPHRRYATANELAMDARRYLSGETILARPPSKLYVFRKIFLRNKLLFTAISIITFLLVVGLILISVSFAREREARKESDSDKLKAQEETRFLESMLQSVGPSVALGQDTAMLRGILDHTVEHIGVEMTNQPDVEAELREVMGTVYRRIGNYHQAEEMHRAAVGIRRRLFGSHDPKVAESLNELGLDFQAENKLPEAEEAGKESLIIRQQAFGLQNADTATSMNNLGAIYRDEGNFTQAEELIRQSLAIRQKIFGTTNLDVADSLRNLGMILGVKGEWAGAEESAREALAIRRILLGPEDPWVASALEDVAWAASNEGKLEEAESLQKEALLMRQKLLPAEDPDVAASLGSIGDTMRERGNFTEACSVLNAALSIQRKVLGEDNPATLFTLRDLGLTLEDEGKLAESEQIQREALAGWTRNGRRQSSDGLYELKCLTSVLVIQKKFADAAQIMEETLTPSFARQPASEEFLDQTVNLEARSGNWDKAAAYAALAFTNQPLDAGRYCPLAALLVRTHQVAAYEELRRRFFIRFENTTNIYIADQVAKTYLFLPPPKNDLPAIDRLADLTIAPGNTDEGGLPFYQYCKALSEYRQGNFAEAALWAQKSINGPRMDARGPAYAILAMANWQLGQKDQAQAALAKGNALAPNAVDPGEDWLKWLYARIFLDEATTLISNQTKLTNGVGK